MTNVSDAYVIVVPKEIHDHVVVWARVHSLAFTHADDACEFSAQFRKDRDAFMQQFEWFNAIVGPTNTYSLYDASIACSGTLPIMLVWSPSNSRKCMRYVILSESIADTLEVKPLQLVDYHMLVRQLG